MMLWGDYRNKFVLAVKWHRPGGQRKVDRDGGLVGGDFSMSTDTEDAPSLSPEHREKAFALGIDLPSMVEVHCDDAVMSSVLGRDSSVVLPGTFKVMWGMRLNVGRDRVLQYTGDDLVAEDVPFVVRIGQWFVVTGLLSEEDANKKLQAALRGGMTKRELARRLPVVIANALDEMEV